MQPNYLIANSVEAAPSSFGADNPVKKCPILARIKRIFAR
jgi:hypothetical protein